MRMRTLFDLAVCEKHDLSLRYAAAREMQQQRQKLGKIGEPPLDALRIMYNTRFRRSLKEGIK